jgi:hypothetical protein
VSYRFLFLLQKFADPFPIQIETDQGDARPALFMEWGQSRSSTGELKIHPPTTLNPQQAFGPEDLPELTP